MIEGRVIAIVLRALEPGVDVVVDFGLWSRAERSALPQPAVDPGAAMEIRYVALPSDEQRRRLDRRQAGAFSVPPPVELDGSEPVDDRPADFASW